MNIGIEITKHRKKAGLTMHELCEASGVSYTLLWKIEKNKFYNTRQLIKVLDFLGLELKTKKK